MATKRPAKKTAKPKRSSTPDFNQVAQRLVRLSTGQDEPTESEAPTRSEISRVMAELGRRGGKIGGAVRASRMTPEQRSDSAALAARALWAKKRAEAQP